MVNICSTNKCTGCTACKWICEKNAITMVENNEGFYYPVVDREKCIDCELCKRTCPSNTDTICKNEILEIYALKNKDMASRLKSRSGGLFPLLSDIILKNGGIVYGVGFDDELNVIHKRVDNIKEIDNLRGSKYVDSRITNSFSLAKADLDSGRDVLFCGTPCQIAGLKAYLRKNYDNLITVDVICHGVPSQKIYREYIDYILKKHKTISDFNFRDKKMGWNTHIESYGIKGKRIYSELYRNVFYSDLALKLSCYNCHYASLNRVSDITLGDFWGIEELYPKFNDNKGVSQILINTEKGKKIFSLCKENVYFIKISKNMYDYIVERQPCLRQPSALPKNRTEFWKGYYNEGFDYILNNFGENDFISKAKLMLKIVRGYFRMIYKHK